MSVTGGQWMAGEQGHTFAANLLVYNEPQESVLL